MSSILFSVETFTDGEKDIRAIFASEDSLEDNNCLEQIVQIISSFVSEDRNIKFVKKYLGPDEIKGTFINKDTNKPKKSFFVLVRLIDKDVDKVIKISETTYDLNEFCKLLNDENKEENREYRIFECPGELKH